MPQKKSSRGTQTAKRKTGAKAKATERAGFSMDAPSFSFTDYLNSIEPEHIQNQLCELWKCWSHVLGEELARYALPLGHKKRTLIIGCTDSVEIQDLRYAVDNILENVNGFLGKNFFTAIRVELLLSRQDLQILNRIKTSEEKISPISQALGIHLSSMDQHSPVARCYQAFVQKRKEMKEKNDRPNMQLSSSEAGQR